jgi:hypothetical protein
MFYGKRIKALEAKVKQLEGQSYFAVHTGEYEPTWFAGVPVKLQKTKNISVKTVLGYVLDRSGLQLTYAPGKESSVVLEQPTKKRAR